jgi:hypothetical protein
MRNENTFIRLNWQSSASVNCTPRLHGMTVNGASIFTYNLNANGWLISPTAGTQSLQTGYATLTQHTWRQLHKRH